MSIVKKVSFNYARVWNQDDVVFTSLRYAMRAWARKLDVAASTADCIVAFTIGDGIFKLYYPLVLGGGGCGS